MIRLKTVWYVKTRKGIGIFHDEENKNQFIMNLRLSGSDYCEVFHMNIATDLKEVE